jgi:hypothetical protein
MHFGQMSRFGEPGLPDLSGHARAQESAFQFLQGESVINRDSGRVALDSPGCNCSIAARIHGPLNHTIGVSNQSTGVPHDIAEAFWQHFGNVAGRL